MPPVRRRPRPISPEEILKNQIQTAFTTPGNPIAFSTPDRVSKHFNISPAKAREYLEEIDGYTLHREYKQPQRYNPYYVHNRREQTQADLIDISKIARSNNNVKFLLVIIDIMTKFLWVFPIKNKSGATMRAVLNRWLRGLGADKPKILKTDRGLEFTCAPVQTLLQNANVEWQPAFGTLKACIAERVNKTLQILIYKYLTEKETLRYIDVLPNLVSTYNKRGHRTLEGMSPENADKPENEAQVQAIFHSRYTQAGALRPVKSKYRVGDIVRVKTEPKKISSSARAYAEQFHGEYFRIVRINRTLPVPLYYLRSTDSGDFIDGGFYANELQRQRGDVYKIEQVLQERRRGRRRELLVKWKYFGPRWNSWVNANDVVGRF